MASSPMSLLEMSPGHRPGTSAIWMSLSFLLKPTGYSQEHSDLTTGPAPNLKSSSRTTWRGSRPWLRVAVWRARCHALPPTDVQHPESPNASPGLQSTV
eukprot:9431854-Heterocapsa_arctica.AAC.1